MFVQNGELTMVYIWLCYDFVVMAPIMKDSATTCTVPADN